MDNKYFIERKLSLYVAYKKGITPLSEIDDEKLDKCDMFLENYVLHSINPHDKNFDKEENISRIVKVIHKLSHTCYHTQTGGNKLFTRCTCMTASQVSR